MSRVYSSALRRAAEILGGVDRLRDLLRVPAGQLESWVAGSETPPIDVFLKAVDVISSARAANDAPNLAIQRARELRTQSSRLHGSLQHSLERAQEIRAAILATQQAVARRRARATASGFLGATFEPADGRGMIEAALDAALELGLASRGNLQLVLPGGLHIVAQHGFEKPFLDFFSVVNHPGSACGAAAEKGARVVVSDVQSDPIFAGTAAADVLARAGVRAVQSTPLISQTGALLGMLSTHYEDAGDPGEECLRAIESVAKRAAFWLEGGRA
jgi:hypothetical protein